MTTTETKTNPREERGLAIAAKCKLMKREDFWVVPSQTGQGKYYVRPAGDKPSCTCPDHQELGHKCKHIFAVQIVIQRELFPDGSAVEIRTVTVSETTVRKTYPQNWPAYNAAQTNEKDKFQVLLRDLCKGLAAPEPPKRKRGEQPIPIEDAIFSAVFKVYSTFSGRRFMSDLRESQENGFINRLPCYNSIFGVLESPGATPILHLLIQATAAPLKSIETGFACDSSGFSGSRFDRWYDAKYGADKSRRSWVKCHLMCGVKTNVVTAVEISPSGDAPRLPGLLAATCPCAHHSGSGIFGGLLFAKYLANMDGSLMVKGKLMPERILRIPFAELATVRVRCCEKDCGVIIEVVVNNLQNGPLLCPGCHKDIRTVGGIDNELHNFVRSFVILQNLKAAEFQFSISLPE